MAFTEIKRLLLTLWIIISTSQQQHPYLFESTVQLTTFGTLFQPRHPVESLGSFSNIQSLFKCVMRCNQNRQCRTFDYDRSSLVCRLFEGDMATGTVVNNATLISSRIGSIRLNTPDVVQQYSSYNQTCNRCDVGKNRYLECDGQVCRCPIHTYWNGVMCLNQPAIHHYHSHVVTI